MPARRRVPRVISEPAMSDKTLLVSVEDLIYTAFGVPQRNKVNFKLIQTILLILARQMRLLEQDIEIKIDEIVSEFAREGKAGYDNESGRYSSNSAEDDEDEGGAERGRQSDERRKRDGARKAEKGEKGRDKGRREKAENQDGKTSSKDREGKGRSKDRDDKDKRSGDRDDKEKRSRDRDKRPRDRVGSPRDRVGSPRDRRGEDYGDEGGRTRGRGRELYDGPGERGGERGADGRGGRGGERKDRDAQGQVRGERDFGRQTPGSSITISETTRSGSGGTADKILVAERGPATRVRPARIGSIEVVTASQFALLEKAVKQLEQITGPLPEPVLPNNETLRQDLATGRASLQDTMQAVQLNARVQAAEQGLHRMAELLTQLAQSGLVPPEFAGHVGSIEEYLQATMPDEGGAGAGLVRPGGRREKLTYGLGGKSVTEPTASGKNAEKSAAALAAEAAAAQDKAGVTHSELYEVMGSTKNAVFKDIDTMIARANHSADMASSMSRSVAEKLDIAMQIDGRVTTLLQATEDYANELGGLDTGIRSQVNHFHEDIAVMKSDLAAGLALLGACNNNAETVALLDLKERHQGLVDDLENTVEQHQNIRSAQHQMYDEIKNIIRCVEMLREQKVDRDEMIDGLKDKADLSRLAGLLYEKDFAHARSEIEKRISKCYEVFTRQDLKWQDALIELMDVANNKAEIIMLMSLRDATNAKLNDIRKHLHKLEIMLGEPKVAMLMRRLAADASCGACLTRALMEPEDATHGAPLPLPALRPPPLGAERQPCYGEVHLAPPDMRDHTCHRWVGGSHTLLSNIAKVKAKHMKVQIIPTKKFAGYGIDGKLYMMEEDMQPCVECNKFSTDELGRVSQTSTTTGAGDQASGPTRRR